MKIFSKIKDIAFIGSGNGLASLISAVFWFYVAAELGTEGYGKISFLIAIASIVHIISMLGIGNTVVIYTSKEDKKQSSLYFLGITSGVIASVITFIIIGDEGISLYIFGSAIFTLATSEILGRKFFKKMLKVMVSQRILMVTLAITFYWIFGINGIIMGYGLSFFPYIIIVIKGMKEEKISFNKIKGKLPFMMHSYSLNLSRRLSLSLDKLIILPIFGFALLGNYQLGIQILTVMSILPIAVFQYLLPQNSQINGNGKIRILTIVVSVFLALFTLIASPIILPKIFPDFNESIQIVQILSFAIIPITINFMYISKFLAIEKSKIVAVGSIIFIGIQIFGIFVLSNIYDIIGAAFAMIIAAICQSIFLVIMHRKLLGKFI